MRLFCAAVFCKRSFGWAFCLPFRPGFCCCAASDRRGVYGDATSEASSDRIEETSLSRGRRFCLRLEGILRMGDSVIVC